ncbi:Neuroligin-1 [Folsomia candida]|uniref:Neuroligin-1 n=1 Tax=Folsomia candida TaxID=158441 RepID=A0A226DMK0_FOLCA|nr:Neuroligin-1 [Folsomia candida]
MPSRARISSPKNPAGTNLRTLDQTENWTMPRSSIAFFRLELNVKISEGKVDRPVPCLIFIHGDDFSYGGGHPYDPTMLVSQGNIIVITFNFRLGILGECSTTPHLRKRKHATE